MKEDRNNNGNMYASGIRTAALVALACAVILCFVAAGVQNLTFFWGAIGAALAGLLLLGLAEIIRLLDESLRTQKSILRAVTGNPVQQAPAYGDTRDLSNPGGGADPAAGPVPMEGVVASGACGENVSWRLEDNGTLTISGSGAISNHDSARSVPWHDHAADITAAVIETGVASIGKCAFDSCTNLTTVSISDSVTVIGLHAFDSCSALTGVIIPDSVTFIGDCAFQSCSALTAVNIPSSVKFIGYGAFEACPGLADVCYSGSEADWAKVSVGRHNKTLANAAFHFSG